MNKYKTAHKFEQLDELDRFLGKWEIPKLTKNKKKIRTGQSWVKKLRVTANVSLSLQSYGPILLYSWAPQSMYRVKNSLLQKLFQKVGKGEKKKLSDSFDESSLTSIN